MQQRYADAWPPSSSERQRPERRLFTRTPAIDARTAADRLAAGSVVVVDVRQQAEWKTGHIRGVVHIPLTQLPHRLQQLPSGKTIVTICRSGHRSVVAAQALTRAGHNVLNLRGGMNAWARAGSPRVRHPQSVASSGGRRGTRRIGTIARGLDQEAWNRRYQGHELVWTAQPNRFLVGETTTLRPARALDLACGEGRNAVWLAEQGWKVTGVDFSEVALEKAGDLAARRRVEVEWVHADLLRYEPPISAFDLVLVFYLQVTAEKRSPILSRAATALRPGGTFLLVGHDASNLERGFGGPRDPDVLYTAEDVTADLTGLEIERATSIMRTVETDEGTREAIDVLVRARRPQ